MKKFILKLLVYILPFGIIAAPFLYVAVKSGEIIDFDRIMKAQNASENVLLGMAYNEQTKYYKFRNANDHKADIIALGTSRVMQFKERYFAASFYNCGGAVSGNFDEYLDFLMNLEKDAQPKHMILGLDSWVFNDAWNEKEHYGGPLPAQKQDADILGILKKIGDDYTHKWNFRKFMSGYNNIGFSAIMKGNGFQKDGSYCYTDNYLYPKQQYDYQFKDTFQRIETGNARFQYGTDIDPESLLLLDKLLAFCKENQIMVDGFIPPFAPSVLAKMEESGNYDYLSKIAPAVKDIFNQYEYEIYDFTDASSLGCDDSYFIDGFHGSDIVYGMILKEMCRENQALKEKVDYGLLEELIKNRYSNLTFEGVAD